MSYFRVFFINIYPILYIALPRQRDDVKTVVEKKKRGAKINK